MRFSFLFLCTGLSMASIGSFAQRDSRSSRDHGYRNRPPAPEVAIDATLLDAYPGTFFTLPLRTPVGQFNLTAIYCSSSKRDAKLALNRTPTSPAFSAMAMTKGSKILFENAATQELTHMECN